MTTFNMDSNLVYVGYAPCGCVASVGVPGSGTAESMASEGLRIETSTDPVTVDLKHRCPHTPKWGGLPNWEDGTA